MAYGSTPMRPQFQGAGGATQAPPLSQTLHGALQALGGTAPKAAPHGGASMAWPQQAGRVQVQAPPTRAPGGPAGMGTPAYGAPRPPPFAQQRQQPPMPPGYLQQQQQQPLQPPNWGRGQMAQQQLAPQARPVQQQPQQLQPPPQQQRAPVLAAQQLTEALQRVHQQQPGNSKLSEMATQLQGVLQALLLPQQRRPEAAPGPQPAPYQAPPQQQQQQQQQQQPLSAELAMLQSMPNGGNKASMENVARMLQGLLSSGNPQQQQQVAALLARPKPGPAAAAAALPPLQSRAGAPPPLQDPRAVQQYLEAAAKELRSRREPAAAAQPAAFPPPAPAAAAPPAPQQQQAQPQHQQRPPPPQHAQQGSPLHMLPAALLAQLPEESRPQLEVVSIAAATDRACLPACPPSPACFPALLCAIPSAPIMLSAAPSPRHEHPAAEYTPHRPPLPVALLCCCCRRSGG